MVLVVGLELGSDKKKILFDKDNNLLGIDESGNEVSFSLYGIKKVELFGE